MGIIVQMPDTPDMELVQEFARSGSETAFGEIVRRHLNLVYSVAHRCTGNDGDAQDVAQAVFIVLARKAGSLSAKTVLPGWLYETTRHIAARQWRTDTRRHAREQEAYMQSSLNDGPTTPAWTQLAPHLEAAMSGLSEDDRTLLVLRYYQNRTGAQAAAQLGLREDAVHKRTGRALEKLRTLFTQRGITLSAAAIAAAVSAHSVQAAPAALAGKITSAAVISATIDHGTGLFSAATPQKAAVGALLAAAVGWFSYQAHETASLRDQVQSLQQAQAPLQVSIQQLEHERDAATSQAAALKDELAKNQSDTDELLRLRGEVGVIRQEQLSQRAQPAQTISVQYDVITKHETTLIGLVQMDDFKLAILDCRDWFPNNNQPIAGRFFIREGQSYEDAEIRDAHVKIEIIKIDSAKGTVEARENGVSKTYRFQSNGQSDENAGPASLWVQDSSLNTVFDLYEALAGNVHTLLIHQDARRKMPVAIAANPQNQADAIRFLAGWINDQGFTIIPDGSKFELIVPTALADGVHPGAAALPAPEPEDNRSGGNIDFKNADFDSIRHIYAALSGREILQNGRVSAVISLHTGNPLSKAETLYALDTLLGWQGIKIVKVDSKTSKVVRADPQH